MAERGASQTQLSVPIGPLDKIARLLGVLAVKSIDGKDEEVLMLRSVGFEISEVAAMLSMSENAVSVAVHRTRKRRARN